MSITGILGELSGDWYWLVGIIIIGIVLPIMLHFFGIIKLKNPLKRKKQYGERFGHGMK